ncbi:hypothetical protein IAR50_003504 [Cryptococcus sp. DSM 104548]
MDGAGGVADSLATTKLAPISSQVSVLSHRSHTALHFFTQESLDDAGISGHFSSSFVASPAYNVHFQSDAHPQAKLVLVKYAGSGRLWDAFCSVITVGNSEKKVITKVMCPGTYDCEEEYTREFFRVSEAAVSAYRREAALYSDPLAKLQGGAVPVVYASLDGALRPGLGIYGNFPILFELLEDVGPPAAKDMDLFALITLVGWKLKMFIASSMLWASFMVMWSLRTSADVLMGDSPSSSSTDLAR